MMTTTELLGRIEWEIQNALGAEGSETASQRKKALDYYYSRPLGNEIEGRSQVVISDVMDTIEWMMPSLMRIFTGSERLVTFEPTGPEDEEEAQQQTDYVNHILLQEANGFLLMHSWLKDALLYGIGVVKRWWDASVTQRREKYDGLDTEALAALMADPEVQVVDQRARQDPESEETVYDVIIVRREKGGRLACEVVPPEEFLVSRDAPGLDLSRARFVAHRTVKTLSDLRAMGFDVSAYDVGHDTDTPESMVAMARHRHSEEADDAWQSSADPSMKRVTVTEAYIRVDYDGDGIAERRRVLVAGRKVLENEETDEVPFSVICPIPMPHTFGGLSVAELVMKLQEIRSTLFRLILDNMYRQNFQRVAVWSGRVNLDDLLNNSSSDVVRCLEQPRMTIQPIQVQPFSPIVFSLLDYTEGLKEQRTGQTKYNMGLDANTLNKTATGVVQIISQAQQRIELIARIFAETGVKDLFRATLELVSKHQRKARVVKLRNKWVSVDPSGWKTKRDLTVSFGFGATNKDQTLGHLTALWAIQREMLANPALAPLVTPQNVYNLVAKIVENSGFKDISAFFTPPAPEAGGPPLGLGESLEARLAAQLGAEQAIQAERDLQNEKLEIEKARLASDHELRKAQLATKIKELELKYQTAAGMGGL